MTCKCTNVSNTGESGKHLGSCSVNQQKDKLGNTISDFCIFCEKGCCVRQSK